MCSKLKKLNLRNNLIEDEDNIYFLSNLTELKYLNLNQNPIQKSSNYKKLIQECLNFIDKIDINETVALNLPKTNANFDIEDVFDLNKKELPVDKKKLEINKKNSMIKTSSNSLEKNLTSKDTKESFFSISKSKLARFNEFNKISPDKIADRDINNTKKELDPLKKTHSKFTLKPLNNQEKNTKIVIDASVQQSSTNIHNNHISKSSNIHENKENTGTNRRNSKIFLAKLEESTKNLLEKHKAPSKDELLQKLDKMNKEMSQKSQDVTKRLYPVRNMDDFEKTAQKTLGKFKIVNSVNQATLQQNSQVPGLLKKTRESKNILLPKINDQKQTGDIKNETKSNFYKKETVK